MEVYDPRQRDYYAVKTRAGQIQVVDIAKGTPLPEDDYVYAEKMSYGEFRSLMNKIARRDALAERKAVSPPKAHNLFWLIVAMGSREIADAIGGFLNAPQGPQR